MTLHKSALMPVDQALETLIKRAPVTASTQKLNLEAALDKVLAQDLVSNIVVPPTDNSAVDGYACASSDLTKGMVLPLSQRIQAGSVPAPLAPGSAARIFTGAEVPSGADCVIMQEDCVQQDDKVVINTEARSGQNIRQAGQDVKLGEKILSKGQVLTAPRLGLIASIGIRELDVFRPLKVAILSTGDELAEPGTEAKPGQIYNSNRYTLMGLLSGLDIDVIDLGRIPDSPEATTEALRVASEKADLIITTGGASVGEADYIQSAIKALGSIEFWRLAIKPGKPFMHGEINKVPIMGLPGNPSAVLVTFMILVRPFLLKMQGCTNFIAWPAEREINFDVHRSGKRREFLRVSVTEQGTLKSHQNQSSGMLSSASWADGLAEIEANTCPRKGDKVKYYSFADLLHMPH